MTKDEHAQLLKRLQALPPERMRLITAATVEEVQVTMSEPRPCYSTQPGKVPILIFLTTLGEHYGIILDKEIVDMLEGTIKTMKRLKVYEPKKTPEPLIAPVRMATLKGH